MKWLSPRRLGLAGILAATIGMSQQGFAHEFWIEPAASALKDGERLTANLKVGLNFRASPYHIFGTALSDSVCSIDRDATQ